MMSSPFNVVLSFVWLAGWPAYAEEAGEGRAEAKAEAKAGNEPARELFEELRQKGYTRDSLKELAKKRRKGEQLTPEEEEIARKAEEIFANLRAQGGGREGGREGGRGWGGGRAFQASPFVRVKMNPLDGAYQGMAEAYYAAKKYTEAVESLKSILDNSPDEEAKHAAHFNTATIYRRGLAYYTHAAPEYLKVKGVLRSRALRELVEMYQEANDPELAINTLTELAKATQDETEKVNILQTLAQAYTRLDRHDEAVQALKQIAQMLTYEKAVEMKELYTQGDSAEALQGMTPMMMGGMGGMQGGGFGPWGRGGFQGGPGGGPGGKEAREGRREKKEGGEEMQPPPPAGEGPGGPGQNPPPEGKPPAEKGF